MREHIGNELKRTVLRCLILPRFKLCHIANLFTITLLCVHVCVTDLHEIGYFIFLHVHAKNAHIYK